MDAVLPLSYPWVLLMLVALYGAYILVRFGSREKELPPGPPTIPILGNAHQLVGKNIYRQFREWGDQYGEIYSLKAGKGTIIVLNSKRVVNALLDKRSILYSHRPADDQFYHFARGENIAMMNPGPLWKLQRKLLFHIITPSRLEGETGRIFEAETKFFMHQLLSNSIDYRKYIKRCTASAAVIILCGHRARTFDDFWVRSIYEGMELVNAALTPGSFPPTEQFPILRLIPEKWIAARRRAQVAYETITNTWLEALSRIEQRRRVGDRRDSLLDEIFDERVKMDPDMSPTELANFIASVTNAAADTSAVATITNILHLAKHRGFQEKARVQLDKACGLERSPNWTDFADAPYVNCIMKEGQRIHPVAPLGFPHRVPKDDWYNGMLIPKDATIIVPSYGLGRTQYEDGDTYNPDRYLNYPRLAMDYASSPDYEDRDHYAYGAGRRICAGIHLAERTQWRILASLLWGFTISPVVDEATGEELEIDTEAYEDAFVSEPKFFPVSVKVRSPKHAEIIRREFRDIEGFLSKWD